MHKNIYILLGLIILVAGVLWFTGASPAGSALADELDSTVLELEDVLDDLSIDIRNNTLSPEELLHTQRDIITALDRIDAATEKASGKQVTTSDLRRIQDGLGRLARILETYLDSIAALDQQIATIPPDEYPDDIDESQRERTVLLTAISTITNLAEIATVEGEEDILEDTVFEGEPETNSQDEEADEQATTSPTGGSPNDAIQLELAPSND